MAGRSNGAPFLLALLLATASAASSPTPTHSKKNNKKWCPSPTAAACGLATETELDALEQSVVDWSQSPTPFIAKGTAAVGGNPGPCQSSVSPDAPSGSTASCVLGSGSGALADVLLSAACPEDWIASQATCFAQAFDQGGMVARLPIVVQGTFGGEVNCVFSAAGLQDGLEIRSTAWVVCTAPYEAPTTDAAAKTASRMAGLQRQLVEEVMA